MRFRGKPNRYVNKRVRRRGKWRVVPWFKFDENGFVDIDEKKVSKADLNKIARIFPVVKDEDEKPANTTKPYGEMSYKELQSAYSDKFDGSPIGKSKAFLLEKLEG